MQITEFTNIPQSYIATVRVVLRDGSTTARTTLTADTYQQARAMLTRIYGDNNVVSIIQVMNEDDGITEGTKTLSSEVLGWAQ